MTDEDDDQLPDSLIYGDAYVPTDPIIDADAMQATDLNIDADVLIRMEFNTNRKSFRDLWEASYGVECRFVDYVPMRTCGMIYQTPDGVEYCEWRHSDAEL